MNRDALWKISRKIRCPLKFIFYERVTMQKYRSLIVWNGKLSKEIPIDNNMEQGDILTRTFFTIFFVVMLTLRFQDCAKSILLQIKTTGRIFDLRRFNFKYWLENSCSRHYWLFWAHSQDDIKAPFNAFSAEINFRKDVYHIVNKNIYQAEYNGAWIYVGCSWYILFLPG